jgi:hypothetical protein
MAAMQKPVQKNLQNVVKNLVHSSVQKHFVDVGAEPFAEANAAPEGRPVYRMCVANLTCSSSGATCNTLPYRSLLQSYRNWWLTAGYKQVAPTELKHLTVVRAVSHVGDYAEHRADIYADARAVFRAETDCGSCSFMPPARWAFGKIGFDAFHRVAV